VAQASARQDGESLQYVLGAVKSLAIEPDSVDGKLMFSEHHYPVLHCTGNGLAKIELQLNAHLMTSPTHRLSWGVAVALASSCQLSSAHSSVYFSALRCNS